MNYHEHCGWIYFQYEIFFFGNHGRFGLKPQPDSKMCIYALGIRKSKSI